MKPLATILSDLYPQMPAITWHLLTNRTVQKNGSSCSVASLSIALNAVTSICQSGNVEKPLRESIILDMLPVSDLRRNLSEGTGGATLEQSAQIAIEAVRGLKHLNLSPVAHHMDEAGGENLEKFKQDLVESVLGKAVIIANYHQGVATGKDLTHGHFAPVSPLDFEVNQICVVDPAREGLPFVTDLEHLGRAMATRDKTSQRNRGYLKLSLDI